MKLASINKDDVLLSKNGGRFTVVRKNPTTLDVVGMNGRKVRAYPEMFTHKAMDGETYKAAIKSLNMSQEAAGVWLGIGKRTSQGWAIGEYSVDEPAAKLLRVCIRLGLNPEEVK